MNPLQFSKNEPKVSLSTSIEPRKQTKFIVSCTISKSIKKKMYDTHQTTKTDVVPNNTIVTRYNDKVLNSFIQLRWAA